MSPDSWAAGAYSPTFHLHVPLYWGILPTGFRGYLVLGPGLEYATAGALTVTFGLVKLRGVGGHCIFRGCSKRINVHHTVEIVRIVGLARSHQRSTAPDATNLIVYRSFFQALPILGLRTDAFQRRRTHSACTCKPGLRNAASDGRLGHHLQCIFQPTS